MNRQPLRVAVLGSSGSIGRQTLQVIESNPSCFQIVGLSVHRNLELLAEQTIKYRPELVAVEKSDLSGLAQVMDMVDVVSGPNAFVKMVERLKPDILVTGIVGFVSLPAIISALELGVDVALANKESIVCAAAFLRDAANRGGSKFVAVDSEHSSLSQCLKAVDDLGQVKKLILTASGGPFWKLSRNELEGISVAQAVKHPTWSMGHKISIDSATMVNKGLEIIEAVELFGIAEEQIEVALHPESIVHAMVSLQDGSMLASLSRADMRVPIARALYELAPGEISNSGVQAVNLFEQPLSFHPLDAERFPAVRLAREAVRLGQCAQICFNAANEVAVNAFVAEELSFQRIESIIENTIKEMPLREISRLSDVHAIDQQARDLASSFI